MGPTCRIQSYTASDRLAKSRCRFGQLAGSPDSPLNLAMDELMAWNRLIKSIGGLPDELKGVVSDEGSTPCPAP